MSWALFHQPASRQAWLATAGSVALVACPAFAQEAGQADPPTAAPDEPDLRPPAIEPTASDVPATDSADEIAFAADNLNYDSESDVVIAEGNVQMNRDGISMRAGRVTWNRATGQVVAEDDVAITNPEGDIAYGDRIELTDSLRDGVVDNLLVVLENGARLAAVRGTRFDNGNIELENAAYTPCPVEDAAGCARARASKSSACRSFPSPAFRIPRTRKRAAASSFPKCASTAPTVSRLPFPITCGWRPIATSRSRRISTPAPHR
jgi:LPS-assembly protein